MAAVPYKQTTRKITKQAVQEGPFSKPWQNSDAVLVVEEKELHVHSMILSLASPVFEKMFHGNFKEALTKRVTLTGKSCEVVEQMLKIIYPNMHSKFEFKTKFCSVCYPKAGNTRVEPCYECSQAKEDLNSLCTDCVRPGTEVCMKCKKYFSKTDEGRSQHFEWLRNLSELSEEYMVPSLSSIVANEVLLMSQSLEGTPNKYVMELLELADTLKYKESTDLCIKFLISKEDNYYKQQYNNEYGLRVLMKERKIKLQTRHKLIGMMMQKKIKQAETRMRQQLQSEGEKHKNARIYNNQCSYSPPTYIDLQEIYDDIKLMAKDMTV